MMSSQYGFVAAAGLARAGTSSGRCLSARRPRIQRLRAGSGARGARCALSPPPVPTDPTAGAGSADWGAIGAVYDVNEMSDLLALVASPGAPLLVVEVYSRACRACIGIKRTYERVAASYAGRARFARVCVDDVDAARKHLNVRAMPLFVFYRNGARIDHHTGGGRERLEEAVEDNL